MPPTVPSANPGVGKRAAEGDGKDDDAKRVKKKRVKKKRVKKK
jgi:hypothetical protein